MITIIYHYPVQIVSFHSIKAADNIKHSLINVALVESPRSGRVSYSNHPRPVSATVAIFLNIIETFLLLVNSSKDKHCILSTRRRMSIPAFNLASNILWRHPDMVFKIENIQIIESDAPVPTSEHHHKLSLSLRSVSKAKFRIWQVFHAVVLKLCM